MGNPKMVRCILKDTEENCLNKTLRNGGREIYKVFSNMTVDFQKELGSHNLEYDPVVLSRHKEYLRLKKHYLAYHYEASIVRMVQRKLGGISGTDRHLIRSESR